MTNTVSKRFQGTGILKTPLRIGIIRALNECTGRLFRATTRHNHKSSDMQSKKISNDQELIQSDPYKTFVDAYDQLISLIKTTNPACKVYLCEIAPRGDVNVTGFNKGIDRLSKHWERQNVHCLSNTYDYFFAKNYLPASRYFSNDGIHLSHSGIKSLLDAMNTTTKIMVDYELFVFSNLRHRTRAAIRGTVEDVTEDRNINRISQTEMQKAKEREAHRDTETLENNASDAIWSDIS